MFRREGLSVLAIVSKPAAEVQLMIAKKYKARGLAQEPYLVREGSYHRCSLCGYPFAADVLPPLDVAFAEHLINSHRPVRTTESPRQDARSIAPDPSEST